MKSLIAKIITPENCGSIIILSSLALLFCIGINYTKLVVPETVLVLAITILLPFGLIAFFAKIYWLFFFWTQYSIPRKFGEILKIAFYTLLLSIVVFPAIKVISLSFR